MHCLTGPDDLRNVTSSALAFEHAMATSYPREDKYLATGAIKTRAVRRIVRTCNTLTGCFSLITYRLIDTIAPSNAALFGNQTEMRPPHLG